MSLLVVECEDRGDAIVVSARGDIDSSTVSELTAKLAIALQHAVVHPARLVILDLQAVTYFGSAGLNAVLDCREEGDAAGTSVRVVADDPQVTRPIEVTNLDRVLEVYPRMADALRRDRDTRA